MQAALPTISNVRAAQRPGTKLVDIYYDLAHLDTNSVRVDIFLSADGGATWDLPARSLEGSFGARIHPGTNKHVLWDAGIDWDGQFTTRCRVRIVTYDLAPEGFVLIPGGVFTMGEPRADEGYAQEYNLHDVYVSAFWLERTKVTERLYALVGRWAMEHGYDIVGPWSVRGYDYPVEVDWSLAVKWCNARSELEGRKPAYYTSEQQSEVYRTGYIDLFETYVDWSANGYRLPTEAEWEKAARGGLIGKRFPWGDTITHNQANYFSVTTLLYDISITRGAHPEFQLLTSPVNNFPPNNYGLYDMAGNVFEWCWDKYMGAWYYQPGATDRDTKGPRVGDTTDPRWRVMRGGAYNTVAEWARCAARIPSRPFPVGMRCVRGP